MNKKLNKGITLIALVITIIVLLILAGVSISMLTGENGLLTKAGTAKETTERAEIIEAIQLDILGKQTDNKSGNITQTDLEEILKDYVADPTTDLVKDDDGTITSVVTKKGNYTIALSEIWSGEITSSGDEEYGIGNEVTIKGTTESFYILKASSEEESTVTLLAKYNLKTNWTEQAANTNYLSTAIAFSTSNYWSGENLSSSSTYFNLNDYEAVKNNTASAVYKANSYALSVGATSGRLMTYEEANTLKEMISSDSTGKISKMLWGKANEQAENSYFLYYWLGSAYSSKAVWFVSGDNEYFNTVTYIYGYAYGVRPVIEISKSLVQLSN